MLNALLGAPIPPMGTPPEVRLETVSQEGPTLKGLFFVHLYGAYEFAVKRMVEESLQYINSQNLIVSDCKATLLSVVLNPQCHSLRDAGRINVWKKRTELFSLVNSTNPVAIDTSLLPTSGRNLDASELESIWSAFGLAENTVAGSGNPTKVREVIQKRNEIAHGEYAPAQIGRRYTLNELNSVLNDIDLLCTHLILSFSDYLVRGGYRA